MVNELRKTERQQLDAATQPTASHEAGWKTSVSFFPGAIEPIPAQRPSEPHISGWHAQILKGQKQNYEYLHCSSFPAGLPRPPPMSRAE